MEDVHVKEWSEFFADAGLTKTDQAQYALSFTNNDVEMQSFCELVSQHTESGITFMKSLGVKPAGHQIKISMKAQKYRNTLHQIGQVESTSQSNLKTEKLETTFYPSMKVETTEEIIEVTPNNNIKTSPTTKHSLTGILQLSPPNSVLNPFFANRIPPSSPPSTINISSEGSASPQSPLQIKSEHFYISVTPDHTLSDLSLPQPEPHLLLENTRRWVEESVSYTDTLTNTNAEENKAAINKLENKGFPIKENICMYSAFGENGIENRAPKGVDDINPTMLLVSGVLDGFSKPHFREVFPKAVDVCLKKRIINMDGNNYFYVHIQFSTSADAEAAFDVAQDLTVSNQNMKVVFAKKDKKSDANTVDTKSMNKDESTLLDKNNKRKREETTENCRLYVQGIEKEFDNAVIVAAFEKYGTVTDVYNPGKGCAVVTFSNSAEAKAAMEALQVTELGGCLVTVSAARSFDSKLRKSSHNVSKEIAYSELWDAVKIHGPVARLKYKLSEQFAFVSFKSSEDAHKAIYAIHGKELCGRKVQCNAGVPSGDGVGFRLKFLDS